MDYAVQRNFHQPRARGPRRVSVPEVDPFEEGDLDPSGERPQLSSVNELKRELTLYPLWMHLIRRHWPNLHHVTLRGLSQTQRGALVASSP
jgi:hypothetical protein